MNKWEEIKGNWHTKRAIEVALSGGHVITLIGTEEATAVFKDEVNHRILPCPCGNLTSRKVACSCNMAKIIKHFERNKKVLTNAIVCEMPDLEYDLIEEKIAPDTTAQVYHRIKEAQGRFKPRTMTEEAKKILRRIVDDFNLSKTSEENVKAISSTIAKMADMKTICAEHIAEAVQYQFRGLCA